MGAVIRLVRQLTPTRLDPIFRVKICNLPSTSAVVRDRLAPRRPGGQSLIPGLTRERREGQRREIEGRWPAEHVGHHRPDDHQCQRAASTQQRSSPSRCRWRWARRPSNGLSKPVAQGPQVTVKISRGAIAIAGILGEAAVNDPGELERHAPICRRTRAAASLLMMASSVATDVSRRNARRPAAIS